MQHAPSASIVILTGAGISSESGLSTFRDKGGIWSQLRIEDVATPEAFQKNPVRVHQFYNQRREKLAAGEVEPNAAHSALARLERKWPGKVLIVTQNIDDLHERAGSQNIIHMHGELLKVRCVHCKSVTIHKTDLGIEDDCLECQLSGGLRPHVVWFGEMPLMMEQIYQALDTCDLFLSIGTSGNVYPAAGFVAHIRAAGRAHSLELNLEPSEGASLFADSQYGPATKIIPGFVDQLLKERLST